MGPVCERPVKRFSGKSSAEKRPTGLSGELPTSERWKRLILPGSEG